MSPPLFVLPPLGKPDGNGDRKGNYGNHGDYDGNHRPSFPSEVGFHGLLIQAVVRSDSQGVLRRPNSNGKVETLISNAAQ